jgi:hypothetical protein
MPQGAVFFDQTCFPWIDGYPEGRAAMDEALDEAMDHVMWAKFAPTPWDRAGEDGFWDTLRATTLRLRETSDKALLLGIGSNLFEWGTFPIVKSYPVKRDGKRSIKAPQSIQSFPFAKRPEHTPENGLNQRGAHRI